MRSTCSLYIDAGYLLASAATRVTGTSLRSGIFVHYPPLITSLVEMASQRSGLPVLRAHWYDSARNGIPDLQQERIGELPKVKLRLGRFGVNGEQKGVDLRIGLDLVAHARHGASDVFFLVSGDDDLTEAVEEAQSHGVQVVLLAVPNADGEPHGVSRHLVRAVDEMFVVDPPAIDAATTRIERPAASRPPIPASTPTATSVSRPPASAVLPAGRPTPRDLATRPASPTPAATPSAPAYSPSAVPAYSSSTGQKAWIAPTVERTTEHDDAMDAVVVKVLRSVRSSAGAEEIATLERSRPSIPPEIDRALLRDTSLALGIEDLDEAIRYRLRELFWERY